MSRIKKQWDIPFGCKNTCKAISAESQLLRLAQTRPNGGDSKPVTRLVWNIPWSCAECVKQAAKKGHHRAFAVSCCRSWTEKQHLV